MNFFRTAARQADREAAGSLKEGIEKYLEMEGHKYEYSSQEGKFTVSQNMVSLNIVRDETFSETVSNSLQNMFPERRVESIKQIDEHTIEIVV